MTPPSPATPASSQTEEMMVRGYDDALDRSQVVALWNAVFGYEAAHNSPGLAIDRKLAVQDDLFLVALVDGKVIGTTMAGYDGHRGWIYSVAVDPAHRKKGTGTRLVREAERALSRSGCVKINLQILEGNAEVTAFYSSLGYVTEPRINMGKRLPENIPSAVP